MVLGGQITDATLVFSAINQMKPGNRASSLGLALVDFMHKCQAGGMENVSGFHYEDLVMCCFRGLAWLQQGKTAEARVLLETLSQGDDIVSAQLARDILKYELKGR